MENVFRGLISLPLSNYKKVIFFTVFLSTLLQVHAGYTQQSCSGCAAESIKEQIEKQKDNREVKDTVKNIIKTIRDNEHYQEGAESAIEMYETMKSYNKEILPDIAGKYITSRGYSSLNGDMSTAIYSSKNRLLNQTLRPDERLYVFISSSMPIQTLSNYAMFLEELFDERAVMVLRGCINGCRLVKPTMEFVQSFLQYGLSEDNKPLLRKVNVEIDPFLFKKYNITKVPAIVFAWDLALDNETMSEGLDENLKKKPEYIIAYGDVSFLTVLEKMHDYLKVNVPERSVSIKKMIEIFNKSTFFKERHNDY
jgi:type-F conjugative transfer system pilin assembly protein TrbC